MPLLEAGVNKAIAEAGIILPVNAVSSMLNFGSPSPPLERLPEGLDTVWRWAWAEM